MEYYVGEIDVGLQEMLLKVSVVFQFDVNFYGKGLDVNTLQQLTKAGIITFLPGYYYRLQHSTDAAWLVEAEAVLRVRKKTTYRFGGSAPMSGVTSERG